jgi:hypothetical protein
MLVTSNRSVSEWGGVLGDAVVATAILDRLLHHSHILTIRGDSYLAMDNPIWMRRSSLRATSAVHGIVSASRRLSSARAA